MERWMVLVPLVSLSAFAQERPKVPDKAQQIAVQNALRALELATREPGQPIATAAIPSTCAVPLIEEALNKNIDPRFERFINSSVSVPVSGWIRIVSRTRAR